MEAELELRLQDPSVLQSTAVFYATARYGSATPVPASIISRGVGWLVRSQDYTFILYI